MTVKTVKESGMRVLKITRNLPNYLTLEAEDGETFILPLAKERQREEKRTFADVWAELRTLRWKNKQLGKQLGRNSERVHELKGELAILREKLKG